MAIRRVARMGNPILREKAAEVPETLFGSEKLKDLVQDLIDTMKDYGGVGIAAPQIHESTSVAIIQIPENQTRYPSSEDYPLTVFVNPIIKVLDPAEQSIWEGCLSVPGIRGLVKRASEIQVDFQDIDGNQKQLVLAGFPAAVVQHELDHLNGILFVDKISSPDKIAFIEEYQRFHLNI